jgi:hypothetical protein
MGNKSRRVVYKLHFRHIAPPRIPLRGPSGRNISGRSPFTRRTNMSPAVAFTRKTEQFATFEAAMAEVAKYKLKLYDGPASDWVPTKIVASERIKGHWQVLRIVELAQ